MALRTLESVDAALGWFAERGVRDLATDSRRVGAGDAFIAWPGYAVDGRRFIGAALDAGALACLIESEGCEPYAQTDARGALAALAGLKAHTGPLASRFYGSPSERLQVVGVTGTNGKTSTTWWIAQASRALGRRCAVVGTLGLGEPPQGTRPAAIVATGMTTPDPVTLQRGLRRFVDDGIVACAIEATSIGMREHRLDGTRIGTAVFTNFTQDHLDYHGSMSAYWDAKAALFEWPGLRAAVVNVDDPRGAGLAADLGGRGLDVWSCSMHVPARLAACAMRVGANGIDFDVCEGAQRLAVHTRLVGDYNVANLLGAMAALRACGAALADIVAVCDALTPVPGRLQTVALRAGSPQVVVDYAHTPDALEKALMALGPLAQARGGQLWCVFGCGGNRDAAKRPLMGALAQRLAHRVVLTSDNPRVEPPESILDQIEAGLDPRGAAVVRIEDRRGAIEHAVAHARAPDVVLLAGKGHEPNQDIGGVLHPFSDVEAATAALNARWGAA